MGQCGRACSRPLCAGAEGEILRIRANFRNDCHYEEKICADRIYWYTAQSWKYNDVDRWVKWTDLGGSDNDANEGQLDNLEWDLEE